MASQITATLPTLDFPLEADYPTQEDWAAFSAAAEENFGILGGSWSTQMQQWKNEANEMSIELNTNATIAQGLANYQGDWVSQGYTLGQTVSVSGIYYICKLTHASGQNPTDIGSLYWNLAIGNWNLKVNTDMSGYTSKTTPVDADLLPLSDSTASFGIKKLSWANLKTALSSFFMDLTSNQTIAGNKSFTGNLLVTSSTAALGYGTGAGGTVTQLTSKTTSVTLNKPTGIITMNSAALAAGAYAIFIFNNSLITTNDNLTLTIISGDVSGGSYNVWISNITAGVAYIVLKNITAASRSEALTIKFDLIKGAIS